MERKINTVSAYWMTDSVVRCHVGFLLYFLIAKNADKVNGLLIQVTTVFDTHHPIAAIREKEHQNLDFVTQLSLTQINHSICPTIEVDNNTKN